MARTPFRSNMARVAVLFFVVAISTALVFAEASRKRRLKGDFTLIVGLEGSADLNKPFDKVTISGGQFLADVLANGGDKRVSSADVWHHTTEKGRKVTIRQTGQANARVNFDAKSLELNVPFELTFNGKPFRVPVKLTTGAFSDGFGSDRGEPFTFDAATRSATFKRVVGGGQFDATWSDIGDNEKGQGRQKVIVRIVATNATLQAVD